MIIERWTLFQGHAVNAIDTWNLFWALDNDLSWIMRWWGELVTGFYLENQLKTLKLKNKWENNVIFIQVNFRNFKFPGFTFYQLGSYYLCGSYQHHRGNCVPFILVFLVRKFECFRNLRKVIFLEKLMKMRQKCHFIIHFN